MNYDEYLMHLNRQFDESKVKRDKSGRFAKKSSDNLLKGPTEEASRIDIAANVGSTQRKSEGNRFAKMPDDETAELIDTKRRKTEREVLNREYKSRSSKYRSKMKRIVSRLVKGEISLRSAATVMTHATKKYVDDLIKRNFR